jgi:hypothetical protein
VAVGSLRGNGFQCERAILQGGQLTLRQGASNVPDLAFAIGFLAQSADELAGKVITVNPDQTLPGPKVTMRWRTDWQKAGNKAFQTNYLLKAVFGVPGRGKIQGKIYLGLPDSTKSFVAGSFEADIRKPAPPKPPKK